MTSREVGLHLYPGACEHEERENRAGRWYHVPVRMEVGVIGHKSGTYDKKVGLTTVLRKGPHSHSCRG